MKKKEISDDELLNVSGGSNGNICDGLMKADCKASGSCDWSKTDRRCMANCHMQSEGYSSQAMR